MENVPFLPKTLGIKKYRQQMTSKLPANKKYRQLDADGGEFRIIDFESEERRHERCKIVSECADSLHLER